jgi:hypothetical protein
VALVPDSKCAARGLRGYATALQDSSDAEEEEPPPARE